MRIARPLSLSVVAAVAAGLTVVALPASSAQAATVLSVRYAGTAAPVVGQPVAAMIAYSKGKKVTVKWGDGSRQVLAAKCTPTTPGGSLCMRTLTHAYARTGVRTITISAPGALRTKVVRVAAGTPMPIPAPTPTLPPIPPSPIPDSSQVPFTPGNTVPDAPSGWTRTSLPANWADDMLARINATRASVGAPAVSMCSSLTRAAQAYADLEASSSHYDHTGPDGSTPASRAAAQGYGGAVGENLMRSGSTVDSTILTFEGSAPHLANMTSASWQHVGLGHSLSSDVYRDYWVVEFGSSGSC